MLGSLSVGGGIVVDKDVIFIVEMFGENLDCFHCLIDDVIVFKITIAILPRPEQESCCLLFIS